MRIKRQAAPAIALATVVSVLAGVPAGAQVIGTFSWQTQPYCNVVTVTVVQQGGLFQLLGSDNQCGAGTAPVTGTAVAVGGNVAFGLTVAPASGRAAHLSATISLGTLSGTWSDADANTGPFAFGASGGGNPRPAPAAATAITVSQFASNVYGGTGAATTVARSDHDHDARYLEQAQPIVMSVSPGLFGVQSGTGPTTTQVIGPVLSTSGDGTFSLPFAAPVTVGGTSYRLSNLEYCIAVSAAGPFVNTAAVASDDFTGSLPLTVVVSDATDRTATGCYEIAVPASSARAFAAVFALSNTAPGNILFRGLRTTWMPVAP